MTISRRSFGLGLVTIPALVAAVPRIALADDTIRCSIGQKNDWDTMIVQQGIDEGFYRKAGLVIEPTYTEGGSDTIQIVATGTADVGVATGITGVIGAFAHGAPVKILNPEMTGSSDNYFYVRADSPIKSMADMNGKTMAYSRFGSATFLQTRSLAAMAKVTPTFIAAGGISPTRTQVMSGQIDVGWASAPYNFDLLKDNKIRIIARASDVPALKNRTMRVNVINSKYLADHPAAVAKFLRVYAQTVDWMYANQDKSLARFAGWNGFGMDTARETLKYFPKSALATTTVNGLRDSLNDALEFKSITTMFTSDQMRDLVASVPK